MEALHVVGSPKSTPNVASITTAMKPMEKGAMLNVRSVNFVVAVENVCDATARELLEAQHTLRYAEAAQPFL